MLNEYIEAQIDESDKTVTAIHRLIDWLIGMMAEIEEVRKEKTWKQPSTNLELMFCSRRPLGNNMKCFFKEVRIEKSAKQT